MVGKANSRLSALIAGISSVSVRGALLALWELSVSVLSPFVRERGSFLQCFIYTG